MTTIRNGSKGNDVKLCQQLLNKFGNYGLVEDGIFGAKTESAVKDFQKKNVLSVDGIVGPKTWEALQKNDNNGNCNCTCDCCERPNITTPELIIKNSYLDAGQYVNTKSTKDFIVLHHTAGWNNPYNTISSWNRDSQGRVATEFVIGGIKCTDGDVTYDGEVVRAFPEGYWGYHIGSPTGVSGLDKRSVGIETCCFGHIKDGKTYTGAACLPDQICTLNKKFRGYQQFNQYSDKQLESLRALLIYIANRDNIDLHTGLYQWIKKQGADAFEFQADAYNGKVKGIVTHANIRKDKEDMFPQPELIDMILTL
ncbi:MAG: peptidoglycan-binding protein [Erysipelotrichales bacterium]|nr:peptidoglycan-binding protein [Erysipelotrichales bacterium]